MPATATDIILRPLPDGQDVCLWAPGQIDCPQTDIILRPIPIGHGVCLWVPGEVDDCTPVVPPIIPTQPIQAKDNEIKRQYRHKKPLTVEEIDKLDFDLIQVILHFIGRI